MSSSTSSIEREIDEYQDVSSGSYESGKGSMSYSSSSSDEHYSSGVPGVRTYVFHLLRTYVMILCSWLIL